MKSKQVLIQEITAHIISNPWEFKQFISDTIENELKRWKKKDLKDFLETPPS